MILMILAFTPLLAGGLQGVPSPVPSIQLQIRQGLRLGGSTLPLLVRKLDTRVEISANLAEVAMEFVVENPNPWVVEGELSLPVGEDQKVAGFALDMEGKMRNASVVDRAKAEATYTSIVARRVDPGILDQTGRNLYRIRIFPIPAQGVRRVRVCLEQALRAVPDGSLLTMPLMVQAPVRQGALAIHILSLKDSPKIRESPLPGLSFIPEGANWVARQEGVDLKFDGTLAVHLPHAVEQSSVRVAPDRGLTYAYAHLRLPAMDEVKPLPHRIVLAWDCSVSGRKRDNSREWAVIGDYLNGLPDAEVEVWAFNRSVFERRAFLKAGRNLDALKKYLFQLPADGTCDLGALDFTSSGAQEVLLCSPGLSRLFKGEPKTSNIPVQVLLSSGQADLLRMRAIARRTGGEAFDLTARSRVEVRRLLRRLPFQFLGIEVLEGQVENIVPSHPRPVRGGMGLACLLTSPQAQLRLRFGRSGKTEITRDIVLRSVDSSPSATPRKLWAAAKLEEMEEEMPKQRVSMAALAVEHGLVTRDTSLLVLETLNDYLRYGIPVPEEMRSAAQALRPLVDQMKAKPVSKIELPDFSEDLESWRNGRSRWWSQPFRLGTRRVRDEGFFPTMKTNSVRWGVEEEPPPPAAPRSPWQGEDVWCVGIHALPSLGYPGGVAGGDEDVEFHPGQRRIDLMRDLNGLPVADLSMSYAGVAGGGVGGTGMAVVGSDSQARGMALLPGPSPEKEVIPIDDPSLPQAWPDPFPSSTARTPRHWRPGAERAQILARTPDKERWGLYLQYKEKYCQSTGFILDCARIFARNGRRDLAYGIATNLAEEPRKSSQGQEHHSGDEPMPDGFHLRILGELLWELGDFEGASTAFATAQTHAANDRLLLLRRARLSQAQSRPAMALELLNQASGALPGEEEFDPLQGVADEERKALRVRLGKANEESAKSIAWGLRIEVESVFGMLPKGAVSVVDPRGERVWHELPLGTEGLGLDDSTGNLGIFMVRKPSSGTYRVELNPALFIGDDHIPEEVRVRVTFGFGSRQAHTREFRQRLDRSSERCVVATFR